MQVDFRLQLSILLLIMFWTHNGLAQDSGHNSSAVPQSDPVQTELYFQEAVQHFDNHDYSASLTLLDQISNQSPSAHYLRGLCLLRLGRPNEAADLLQDVRNNHGGPDEIQLDEGIARLNAGNAVAAARDLAQYVVKHPDDPHGRLVLGIALYQQGRNDEARGHLDLASSDETLAPYADFYNQQTAPVPPLPIPQELYRRDSNRPWRLAFITGYELDDNVPLVQDFSGLGGDIQKDDSRWVAGLFGDYTIAQDEDSSFGVFGSTYTTFQFELKDFNIQNYVGGIYANKAHGEWLFGLNYQFNETLLNEQQFAAEHRLTLSATLLEGTWGHLTSYYEYDNVDIDSQALIPEQERSGDVNSVGLTQAYYIGPDDLGRIYLGYRFGNTDATGSDFDMYSHMVSGRIEYPINERLVFDLGFRQFFDHYDNPNTLDFFGNPRRDQRIELRTGLQNYLTPNLSLRCDYTFIESATNVRNLFNVEFYTYRRSIFSTQLIYDF